ncbi:protein dachsous [Monomorium pharaonis]|uniref:protein dachsous n=1 Tax=Monomorium pharaonis TaxID=307658 RepID=UPI00174733C7|nr:protein dachsous [Monomorium pharaonis]
MVVEAPRMWHLLLFLVLGATPARGAQPERVKYLEVSENVRPGTRVGFIDIDSPPYLIALVPGSPVETDLIIEPTTGEIRTRVPLDRETRPSYSLVALPSVRVVINVLDENDNAPTFAEKHVDIEFPENSPRDVKRALPPAYDSDLGQYTTQRYEIVSGNHGDAFRLSQQRGRDGVLYLDLQIAGSLDREARSRYHLVIEALDGGTPPLRSRLTVNVTVQDVNDNPPVFNQTRYVASVPENATVGTPVLAVNATDADAGDNGLVEFSINRRQSDREEMFRIDPETGMVYVNKALDFESREHHELVIVARDRGAQPLEASAFLSVSVTDVNDNQPTITVIFLSDDATPKISESALPGEFVARISISDPDSRTEYSNATVTLTGGDGHFGLATRDNIIYLVVVERPLDREEQSVYELSVEATDAGTPPLCAVRTFRLLVTDVNDNAPEFERDRYEAHLLEASEPGTSVLRVLATDLDEGANSAIRYSLANATWFAIDETTGLITTMTHVDCEANPAPVLIVYATDSGRPPLSSSATVRVTIHDLNDNEPIFDKPLYNTSVPENLPVGRCILKVRATDPDCGVNAMVNYTLAGGRLENELLMVHSDTGEICIRSPLDRETLPYLELPVIATDRGGLSTIAIVRVDVLDVNDNLPAFKPQQYNVTLRSDGVTHDPILRLVAIDLDDGPIAYRITSGNEAGIFHIDHNTGELHVVRPSLLLRSPLHQINVTATDPDGQKSVVDAEVRVTISSPGNRIATCEKPRYTVTLKESVQQNTIVSGMKYGPNAPPLPTGERSSRFYLASEEADLALDPNTGMLRIRQPLDRESRDKYVLSIEAHNSDTIGYCQIEVIVEDVNDNPPSFRTSTVRISVPESHSLHEPLYIAHATDPDITPSLPIRYILGQNTNNLFSINVRSGELYLAKRLDYETQQRHGLLITALDGSGLSSNLSLSIEVQDVNDNPPVFERNEYHVEVPEGAKLDSQILQVTAVDLDTGNNARLSYRLHGSIAFRINPITGWIYLAQSLDREILDRHTLTVFAADNGSPAATASASVLVTILDDNDNDPRFEKDFYSFELYENLSSGTLVGRVSAVDADIGKNSLLRYAVVQTNSSFAVDPDTGKITTREPLDRETKGVHELVLEARDQGIPSRAARVPLRVTVLDVNDNSPEIVDPQGDVVSVREEQPPGTEVARVRALDTDNGENASVTYSISKDRDSDGYNVFTIDPISGMIRTKAVLDHEERNVYRVSVRATDAGHPPRHSERVLRVEVLALADNRPTFTSSSLTFNVREDASIGYVVGSVSGASPAGRVAFTLDSLKPMSEFPAFDVDRSSGQVVVAHSLDRENVSEFHMEIRALDTTSLGNPQSIAVSVKIIINDANDNPPSWPQDPIIVRVSEKATIGSIIYNLTASDRDSGLNGELRYGLVAEFPPENCFFVDSLTGALMLTKQLDREERAEYILILKASDRAPSGEQLASTVTARIIVLDQNDNNPVFVAPDITKINVTSNLLPGASLIRVVAMDKDAGDNGRISYVITSGNEESRFTVGYESGIVSLVKPITKPANLEITANDHGLPPRKAVLKLSLNPVAAEASGPPRLLLPNPIAKISENLHVGSHVINVAGSAVMDQGNVTFSIPSNVASNKFTIAPNGQVTLRAPLDREEVARYSVSIMARSNKLLDITTLDVIVMDENDNSPEFRPGSCYSLAVPENQEITTAIHTIAATDLDEGKNGEISYSIVGGNIGSKFILDPITGVLSMTNLDRETVPKYVLTISAKDKGRPSREVRCNLTVIVLDVNDNAPIFLHNQYTGPNPQNGFSYGPNYPSVNYNPTKYVTTVSEDVPPDSSVISVKATDPDQGVNGKITYAIAQETSWLFRVDNLTGVITTTGPLDRERQSSYVFLVVATDGGRYDAKSTSIPVEINISDVNDNAPIFEEYPFRTRVPIGTQPGQNILRVSAEDADNGANGEIVYSLINQQEKPKFRIHPSTGEVTASLSLSQDNGRTYHLEVLAQDKGDPPKSTKGLIELQVGDLADLTPSLKFQNDTYNVVVQENSPAGTEIVKITAVRTDGRRQRVTYAIASGNDYHTFAIDEDTGLLRVNDPTRLDAELWNDMTIKPGNELPDDAARTNLWGRSLEGQQPKEEPRKSSRHILNVVARTASQEVLEAYVKVIIRILDVNDNPPIFTQMQYSATVLEGNAKGDFVMKLSASDADQGLNSRILYHIVDGNPDNAFTISPPYSGVVRTNIVLDREIREKYRLTIIATDQGNPQLTGTAALSVRVIDVNDNQPTFPEHSIISVSEGTAVGAVLTTITANDVDSSPGLTYRFGNVTSPGPFSIDWYGGKVVLRKRLDAETRSEYTLQVIASDGIHEATTDLTVRVTDVNDNAPRFEQAVYVAVLSDGQGKQEILMVNATDDDLSEENSRVRYYLLRPVKGFSVDPVTGVLTVNHTAILRPIPREMDLVIVAEDHGEPAASSVCTVVVRLSSLENALPGREHKIAVKENLPKGTMLMKLSDVDLLDGAIVASDDTSGTFEIFADQLILSKMLDRETRDKYMLQLSSKIENTSTGSLVGDEPIRVTIVVEDVNDNYPHFLEELYEVSIKEDTPRGTTIAVLHAKDDDLINSTAATLVYDITSGNDGGLFRVEKRTGAILVNSTLDCDLEPEVYNLVVMVCDSDSTLPLCALARLSINLEDVNDNSPKFPVSEYLEFVGENEPIGTTVFSARASDLDRGVFGSLNYSIVSAAASGYSDIDDSWKLFAVDESGTIITRAVFDYEQRNRYVFTLRATDAGGRTAAVRVRVEIDSRDEFFPQFTERMYRFGIRRNAQMMAGTVIGHVTATDRDKGPDGRVVYQLTSQHPYFKLNRTTGALIVKQKLLHVDIDESSRLVVSASSGRQGSLSNMTVVEITLMDDNELNGARGATALATPTDIGSNMAVATSGGLADWVLGLLIALLLLILAFGAIFLYLHIRNRRHKKPGTKPGLNGESNATASNSYVDPSAFDTIPIRSVTGVGVNGNGNSASSGGAGSGASCQFAPPKYDEIPPYGTSSQSGQQQATSELSGSDQSGSSGRGSAEDDGDDEEIRMINEGQQTGDSASDLSVHNTQEYLARLGIVDPPAGTPRRPPEALPLDSLHLFEDEASTEADIATLIYGKIGESGRPTSGLEVPGGPSMNGSLSSIVHSEEELTGSYNWDYLLDWGPQYQPLAHVFSEIARLKDDAASVQSGNSGSSGKTKSIHKAPPPPLLTSVAPRSLAAPALARGILPRSPISHDASTFPSAALSPSFSPSLSPLATRSPSISPLVPPATQRSSQSATRGIPVADAELRI